MKIKHLFPIIMLLTLLEGCGIYSINQTATLPPATRYSQEVRPIIDSLITWQADFNNFYSTINDYSNLNYFVKYNTEAGKFLSFSQAGANWSSSTFWEAFNREYPGIQSKLQELISPLQKLAGDGLNIINVIGIVTPTEEITAAHAEVVDCINTRIIFVNLFFDALNNMKPIDFTQWNKDNADLKCISFDAAVTKIVTYVNSNK